MKQRILFASDLDQTLLYSPRHLPAGLEAHCVEYLQDKPQGFFTRRTIALLGKVAEQTAFVPVTTRSLEQYRRIAWPEGCAPGMALVTNGAILLDHGEIDEGWKRESLALAQPHGEELARLHGILAPSAAFLHCRIVDGMFLFASCGDAASAKAQAIRCQRLTELPVRVSGRKIYIFLPELNKGMAVRRLKERVRPDATWAAGDSVIDIPMLREADCALVPSSELLEQLQGCNAVCSEEGRLFSEWLLEHVLEAQLTYL